MLKIVCVHQRLRRAVLTSLLSNILYNPFVIAHQRVRRSKQGSLGECQSVGGVGGVRGVGVSEFDTIDTQ